MKYFFVINVDVIVNEFIKIFESNKFFVRSLMYSLKNIVNMEYIRSISNIVKMLFF